MSHSIHRFAVSCSHTEHRRGPYPPYLTFDPFDAMKHNCLLFLLAAAMTVAGDEVRTNSVSSLLKLLVQFEAATQNHEDRFVLTLTNVSGRALKADVFTNYFLGEIKLEDPNGKVLSCFQKDGLTMALTGIPRTTVLTIPPKGVVWTWSVPFTELRTLNDEGVSSDDIGGQVASAEAWHVLRGSLLSANKVAIRIEPSAPASGASPRR